MICCAVEHEECLFLLPLRKGKQNRAVTGKGQGLTESCPRKGGITAALLPFPTCLLLLCNLFWRQGDRSELCCSAHGASGICCVLLALQSAAMPSALTLSSYLLPPVCREQQRVPSSWECSRRHNLCGHGEVQGWRVHPFLREGEEPSLVCLQWWVVWDCTERCCLSPDPR